ncbi:RNA-directed DNA polymerase, eukaryota, Reverse transcriptase zinc-binding domain protein [Artemisia annua]|uniref:RNA-directed DNA polymerase, eukaryota, Reverse transcriptase zinc-binding domain protein n=1 Tax=Artemisia annua TaxID=35608 RepID=A0A2U1P158_ARTAN|nr:RNA-directed DNA polymerase, eukaryota, Reverse transcriptase zinc-binding domain protein [Artemisia annua]
MSRKISWVSWQRIVAPIESGGLGLGTLADKNLSLLSKWWWRFKTEPLSLWRRTITAIHKTNRNCTPIPCKPGLVGAWVNISKLSSHLNCFDVSLHNLFTGQVGNGQTLGCGLTNGLERNRFVAHTQLYSNLKDTKTVSSKTDAQEMAAFLNGNGNGSRHRQTQTSYINYRRCCLNFEVSYLPTKRTHGNGLAMHQEFSQLSP